MEHEDLPPIWHSETAKIFITALNLHQNNTREDVPPSGQIATKQLLKNRQYEPVSPKDIIDIISFVDNALAQGIITNNQLTQSIEEAVSLSIVWKEIVANDFEQIRLFIAEASIEAKAITQEKQDDNESTPLVDASNYYQLDYYRLIATKIWPWLDNIKDKNSALYETSAKVFHIHYSSEKNEDILAALDEKLYHMRYYGEDLIIKYHSLKQQLSSKPLNVDITRRMIQAWLEIYAFRIEKIMHHCKHNEYMGKPIWSFLYYIGIEQRYTLNSNEIHDCCSDESGHNIAAIVDIDDFIKFRKLIQYVPEILNIIKHNSIQTLSSVLEADGKPRKTDVNHIAYWQTFATNFPNMLNPLCSLCLDEREKYKAHRNIVNTTAIVVNENQAKEPITTPAPPKLSSNIHPLQLITPSEEEKNVLLAHINFMWTLKKVNRPYVKLIQKSQKTDEAHIMAAKFYNQ
ncbi:MAG: hypothetical protein QS748_03925 [Candidatus Endonucleobacter bathymodioli]|uniref:Uncharacterized protein n=1 Tax=Candidatus Endonucleibacter bathymodioli TaxID=539814 RepID=A0AA90SCQ2_9GAMM|nr:hypothetical protein [Candidatus Endonucleobacter bathymodioli]